MKLLSIVLILVFDCTLVKCRRFTRDHFGYSQDLQRNWSITNTACAGHHQSPIHIDTQTAIPLAIPALEFVGYHNLVPRPISITNNGHSVDLKPYHVPTQINSPQIFGGLLPNRYFFDSLHYHWGKRNNRGSEHVINSVRFAMEMHIIHRNEKYESVAEALKHEDGLVVLAFFFQIREKDNNELNPILKELPILTPEGSTVYMHESFTLASLISKSTDIFYTYRGSLTTPPCSEAVTWIIFPDPLPVSYTQMTRFRTLTTGHHSEHIEDNYRHLQPLGTRKIFVRRRATDSSYYRNIVMNHTDSEFWENESIEEESESVEIDLNN
uniref:Carbonic anhydrase n=1 Tax=Clastoptera arizonana TaxID=38151 RepID=A0A1B6CUQ3_9HEMI